MKILVLKLGGQCNLNCKHCHCLRTDFVYNPDIITYINNEKFDRITFSGGEPLIYFDTIKKIVENIVYRPAYKLVTNTTLLTEDMVEFFNNYGFHIGGSYDGANNSRDNTFMNRFYLLSRINSNSLVTLYSNVNEDYDKLDFDVNAIKTKYGIYNKDGRFWMNFMHQTSLAPNPNVSHDTAKNYCIVMGRNLESEFLALKNNHTVLENCPTIMMGFNKWVRKHNRRGVRCINENVIVMNIAGQFMLCPYGDKFVGDIYTGVDWDKVESYIPERCKTCDLWESCENQCIENITDNECFIHKVMNNHFYRLMDKYGYTYKQLAELTEEKPRGNSNEHNS